MDRGAVVVSRRVENLFCSIPVSLPKRARERFVYNMQRELDARNSSGD